VRYPKACAVGYKYLAPDGAENEASAYIEATLLIVCSYCLLTTAFRKARGVNPVA
jgi:hypothetical protein